MELHGVPPPVVLEDSRELREIDVEHFLRRHRPGRSPFPSPSSFARREWDVLVERQELDEGDQNADERRTCGEAESNQPRTACDGVLSAEREIHRPCSREHRQIVRHLVMRAQDAERGRDRDSAPRPRAAVTYAAQDHPQEQRREGAHVQLAVVPRRDERGDLPAQHVRQPCQQRREEAESVGAQKGEGEQPREKEMKSECRVHSGIEPECHAEEKRGVEDVAMLGGDVRQPSEDERIPEREAIAGAER